jgi:hypothetical protein
VKPSISCADPEKFFVQGTQKVKIFNLPLTHQDMINLHSMFMKSDKHTVHTRDVAMSRAIIQKILNSLNYYQNIACLSRSTIVDTSAINIFAIIQKYAQVYGLKQAINQFFIEYIQLDFIWIELTHDLVVQMGQSNIDYFISIMTQHHAMPVIIFHYE